MKIEFRKKNTLFWILQLSGWGLYYLSDLYLFTGYSSFTSRSLFLFSITFPIGLGLTALLRYPYRYLQEKLRVIGLLPVYILLASLITAILWYLFDLLISMPFWDQSTYDDWLKNLNFRSLIRRNYLHFPIILLWSALYFGIKFWWDRNYQKDIAEKAVILAQKAQLQMLRYQLNPHFLFNSLNSIRALVLEDPKTARLMITELSEFLRFSLLPENDSIKPLGKEMEIIKLYFDIEKKRFEEKLVVDYDISPEAEKFQVPALILQPFVENAIKYGMQNSPMPLRIKISASISGSSLILTIMNSGKWVEKNRTTDESQWRGTGNGLDNTRMRLENAYPDNHSLEILKNPDNVTIVLKINAH